MLYVLSYIALDKMVIKINTFFLIFHETICLEYSLEAEATHSQHIFLLEISENSNRFGSVKLAYREIRLTGVHLYKGVLK